MPSLLLLSLTLASFPGPGPHAAATVRSGPGSSFGAATRASMWSLGPAVTPATEPSSGDAAETTEPAPEGGEPTPMPEGEDVDMSEEEGDAPEGDGEPAGDGEPTEGDGKAGDGKEGDGKAGDGEPGDGDAGEGGAMDLGDIFGTSEDHTDVTVVSESGEGDGTPVKTGSSGAATKTRRKATRSDKLRTQVRIVSSAYYDTARVEQRGFGRNENRLEFYFAYTPNDHLQIVGDVEPVFFGVAQTQELDDLATRQMLTPFHIESDAAYVALNDVLPNLDIKIGRQTLVWGTADKFNPTNNINPDDLEDRPLFTEPIANQMIVVDFAPLADKLWFQGVYVPIFYPALLPPSAAAALKDPQAPVPYTNQGDLDKLDVLQENLRISPRLVPEVFTNVKVPRARFTNGQSAIKLGTSLGGVDMSVSYFNGRHDIPTPVLAAAGIKPDSDPTDDTPECCYTSEVTLIYPRMQVIGADFATQLGFLGNMGLWGEGGLFLPQPQSLIIEFPIPTDVTPGGAANDDGMVNPVRSMEGPTIRSTPFIKATAGLDYTFGEHVYVQAQYLRGFIDEFGAGHIGNYVVGGTDLIFFGRHLIFRAFGVADIPTGRDDNGSYVIYPELILVPPWGSVTFELGSFFLLGKKDTKFGQDAAGSSIAFFKVAGSF